MSDQNLTDIVQYLKNNAAALDSREALEKPADIEDPDCDPKLRERAAQWYGAELLKRKTLTPEETKYLGNEIAKCLREAKRETS